MDEYFLITTARKHGWYMFRVQLKHVLYVIFIFVPLLIMSFISYGTYFLIRDKKMTKYLSGWINRCLKDIESLYQQIRYSKYYQLLGVFIPMTKNISINLEYHKKDTERKTINKVINTITHEDLHKALYEIGTGDKNHWAIERML